MTIAPEAKKLVSDLKAVVRDGEDLLGTTAKSLNAKARERLNESLATAREACRQAEDKCCELAERTQETVRKHPYLSVGVALGLGVVLGAVLLREK